MAARTPTRANALLLVGLLFVQFLLMAGSIRSDEGATLVAEGVGRATAPVARAASTVGGAVQGAFRVLGEIRTARGETARLNDEVRRLQAEVDRYKEKELENGRLRRLLEMREGLVPRSVAASVVTTRLSGESRVLVIDRGRDSGIRPDQSVVSWGGAIGRIVSAAPGHATVRLLSDPNSGVSGLVQRSRAEGMVMGRGDGPLEMAYVPKYADVDVGDRVVTSGLDGVFPKGFGIGRVSAVWDSEGAAKNIRIEPELDVDSVEEVLVLLEPTGTSLLKSPEPTVPPPAAPRTDGSR